MEKVIVSKEKCLHCLYGVTGECEMYDEIGKPMDGETCSNYEEAGEDEMADGERIANGDITVDDCIAWLYERYEMSDTQSPTGQRIRMAVKFLNELKDYKKVVVAEYDLKPLTYQNRIPRDKVNLVDVGDDMLRKAVVKSLTDMMANTSLPEFKKETDLATGDLILSATIYVGVKRGTDLNAVLDKMNEQWEG